MPTRKQAKQAFDAMSKDPNIYDQMNDDGKRAVWEYGRDNSLITRDVLNDKARADFDKYVGDYVKYAPTPTKDPTALKADKYANYKGVKVPLSNKKTTLSNKVVDSPIIAPKTRPPKSNSKITLQPSDLFKDLKSTKPQPKKNNTLLGDIGAGIKSIVIDTPMNLAKEAYKDTGDYISDAKKFIETKDSKEKAKALKGFLQNQSKRASDISGGVLANAADTATLGLSTKAADVVTGGKASKALEQSKKDRPGLASAAGLVGYGAPFKVVGKVVSPVVKKIGNTALKATAKGVLEGGVVGGAESTSRQLIEKGSVDPKKVAINAAMFGGIGAAGELVGAGLKNVKLPKKTVAVDRPLNPIGPVAPPKKYTFKTAAQENALKEYEIAAKKVNDYYGTTNLSDGIKKIDSQRPSITKMFDDNTISKNKTAKFLKDAKNRENLTASDYEILDAFYPELVSNYYPELIARFKTPKAPEPVNIFNRVQQDIGVNLQSLVNKLDGAKPDINSIAKNRNLGYAAGVSNKKAAPLKLPNIFNQNKVVERPMAQTTQQPNIFANRTTQQPLQSQTKIVSGKQKIKRSPVDWVHKLYTDVVEVAHPTNRLDIKGQTGTESAKVMANNTRSASGTTEYIVKKKLVNKQGTEIGSGLDEILGQVNKNNLEAFNEYLLHKHNIARVKQAKPIFGNSYTSQMSADNVARLESANPAFKQISQELDEFKKNFSRAWGVDSGMVEKSLMDQLEKIYPNYVPVYRVSDSVGGSYSKGQSNISSNKFIRTATGGNRDVLAPTEALVSWVDKTVKNAKQNDFYNTILDKVLKDPESMRKKGITITKTGADTIDELVNSQKSLDDMVNFEQLRSDPVNGNMLTVMRNGKPVTLKISDPDVFKALQQIKTGHQSGTLEKAARRVTNPFKEVITGINPLFAAKNVFRDIPTSIINTRNNPLQYSKNLITGIKDMASNSELYREFQALGGKGGNMSEGVISNNPIIKGLRKVNSATETLPRYAEYKSTVLKPGSDFSKQMQGIYNANDITVNFGRYGEAGKTMDAITPYLNPSIQGIDKFIQQAKNRPISTALKGATVVTAPILLTNYINRDNPHYKDLDNRTKDTYILIPNLDNVDENGNAKTFFKIPKAREYGTIFGALLERTLRQIQGDDKAFKGFANSAKTNFAPVNPFESNIFTPYINLNANKDFANRTIVPRSMEGRSLELQYDETTTALAKGLGDLLNKSPKQIDYMLKSYTGIIYQLAAPTMSGQPNKAISNQFISNPLYNNQAITDFYDNLDELSRKATDRNFIEELPSKLKTKEEIRRNIFTNAQKEMSELSKQATKAKTQEEVNIFRQKMIDIANRTNASVK